MRISRRFAPLAAFLLLLAAYHLIFGQFYPNRQGELGHDYSLALPTLLDGFFWQTASGILSPPWFSPSFCGGQAFYADPIHGYYMVPQFLAFLVDPLRACYLTVLIFASLGFWGMYLLARRCFGLSMEAGILGAALFMFNGFFAHRMAIGHMGYHSFQLLPLASCLLLRRDDESHAIVMPGVLAGVVLAYLPQAGALPLMLPLALSMAPLLLAGLARGFPLRSLLGRSAVALAVLTGLSLSKTVAGFTLMSNFERSGYRLPGIRSISEAAAFLWSILFISPVDVAARGQEIFLNVQWLLDRHEYEFGLTLSPFLLFLAWGGLRLYRARSLPVARPSGRTVLCWSAAGLVLLLPLAVNVYTPAWNAFLKSLPVLRSSSTMVRWFLAYIPFVCLAAALALDSPAFGPTSDLPSGQASGSRHRAWLACGLVLLMLGLNLAKDREFYHHENYNPRTVTQAWRAVASGNVRPRIAAAGTYQDAQGRPVLPLERNDLITMGASQIFCYSPIFGYGLESFPRGTLHPGPVLEESDGFLNLKNPACYLYPAENYCRPGDHFPASRRADAERFASYRPFPYQVPLRQTVADLVSQASLLGVAGWLGYAAVGRLTRRPRTGRDR